MKKTWEDVISGSLLDNGQPGNNVAVSQRVSFATRTEANKTGFPVLQISVSEPLPCSLRRFTLDKMGRPPKHQKPTESTLLTATCPS